MVYGKVLVACRECFLNGVQRMLFKGSDERFNGMDFAVLFLVGDSHCRPGVACRILSFCAGVFVATSVPRLSSFRSDIKT
jgi:hypothetical protein